MKVYYDDIICFMLLVVLFLVWRTFDFLVFFYSQKIIPYLGFFPYANQLPAYNLPTWISALANFDGLHYLSIARQGYGQYEQAFFPLYPILIKYFTPLFYYNALLTGLIISNVSFLLGLFIFYKYIYLLNGSGNPTPTIYNHLQPFITVLFLLAFPTSFFFGAVYTEGLFFLLVMSTLYFLKKEKYLLVVLFAFLASTTRLIGVFLIVPIIFHFLSLRAKRSNLDKRDRFVANAPRDDKMPASYFMPIMSPIIGLFTYCFYLWQTTGDPFSFINSQPLFGANRSSHIILLPQVYWRYLKIFITADHNFQFYISSLEFLIFNFVFTILIVDLFKNLKLKIKNWKLIRNLKLEIRNYDLIGLNLFSFANLILPTLTGTLSSIPRYSLLSISFFIYLAQLKNNFFKYLILIIFVILHVLLLGYFTQGYFIS